MFQLSPHPSAGALSSHFLQHCSVRSCRQPFSRIGELLIAPRVPRHQHAECQSLGPRRCTAPALTPPQIRNEHAQHDAHEPAWLLPLRRALLSYLLTRSAWSARSLPASPPACPLATHAADPGASRPPPALPSSCPCATARGTGRSDTEKLTVGMWACQAWCCTAQTQ